MNQGSHKPGERLTSRGSLREKLEKIKPFFSEDLSDLSPKERDRWKEIKERWEQYFDEMDREDDHGNKPAGPVLSQDILTETVKFASGSNAADKLTDYLKTNFSKFTQSQRAFVLVSVEINTFKESLGKDNE